MNAMPKRILVVDDERQVAKLIEIRLRNTGYDVILAYDGVEALEKVASDHPDMIITDEFMPRMGGFDLIQKLGDNPDTELIPIIILLENSQDANIFKAWQSGVRSALTKPFNPSELLTFIQRIFESIDNTNVTDDDQDAIHELFGI